MRIISISRLREYWINQHADAEGVLRAWHSHVRHKSVAWHSWGDVMRDFAPASLVGNCVIFHMGGNKYRLITRILYPSQKVFVLRVMTHQEYDKDSWKEKCGCFEPPPPSSKKVAPKPNVPITRRKEN